MRLRTFVKRIRCDVFFLLARVAEHEILEAWFTTGRNYEKKEYLTLSEAASYQNHSFRMRSSSK